MFATFTFAEVPFAVAQDTGDQPIVITPVGGSFAVRNKKKYKLYEIFGRLYRLTEKEYEAYLYQRKLFQESIDSKTEEEILDTVEDAYETGFTHLADIIAKPEFKIYDVSIPLSPYKENTWLYEVALKRLDAINKEKARKKALREAQIRFEDELIIEMLMSNFL